MIFLFLPVSGSLHRTKIASNLLIPESFDGNGQTELEFESDQSRRNIEEGRFSCPLMFSTKFPLNHRCKLNQTIMSLESSVLHQFATNRKGVFCYKVSILITVAVVFLHID